MSKYFFYAAALYSLFVIYGSLVPLDFRDIPLNDALNQFKNIRYLNLGMGSRADWVANILLYIPLAYLWSAAFGSIRHPLFRIISSLIVLFFCLFVAVAIEFVQLFFPPRTVSINDLVAEAIGTVIGILLFQVYGQYFIKLYQQISLGSFLSVKAAITFYILIYLAFSIFPFDFITTFSELEMKLTNVSDHFFMPPDLDREDITRWIVKLLVEMLVLVPLGLLFCLLPYVSHKLLLTILIGFLLGVFVEVVQLFIVSGVVQGISVLTRMLGMGLGAVLFEWASKQNFNNWTKRLQPIVLWSILPYTVLVLTMNGWMGGNLISREQALEKLKGTHFLPLYYFYYTSEAVALVSLLSNIGTYLPIGLMYWMVSLSTPGIKKSHWVYVGFSAAGFAFIIETGKLFLSDKHVDPTDILIAFAAAAGTYIFMNRVMQWVKQKTVGVTPIKKANKHVVRHRNSYFD